MNSDTIARLEALEAGCDSIQDPILKAAAEAAVSLAIEASDYRALAAAEEAVEALGRLDIDLLIESLKAA